MDNDNFTPTDLTETNNSQESTHTSQISQDIIQIQNTKFLQVWSEEQWLKCKEKHN